MFVYQNITYSSLGFSESAKDRFTKTFSIDEDNFLRQIEKEINGRATPPEKQYYANKASAGDKTDPLAFTEFVDVEIGLSDKITIKIVIQLSVTEDWIEIAGFKKV